VEENTMNTRRPANVTTASALLLLLSLFNLSASFQPDAIKPPPPIIIFASVTGIVGLIAVVGLWNTKRWGWLVTVILAVFNTLGPISGIFLAPTVVGKAISVGLIVGYGLALILVTLPTTRKAFA
jgi:hypothetical protein